MSDYIAPVLSKEQLQKMVDDKAYNEAVNTEINNLLKEQSMTIKNILDDFDDDELIPIFERHNCAIIMLNKNGEKKNNEVSTSAAVSEPVVSSAAPAQDVSAPAQDVSTSGIVNPVVLTSSANTVTDTDTDEVSSEHFTNSQMNSSTLTWFLIIILILIIGLFILNKYYHIIKI
jgi:hypothetical protein